ncbi:MAG: hypothetical protein KF782_12355 [Labilithrix sp.]|nr:hypothetical protein [Labilithrix sp.]
MQTVSKGTIAALLFAALAGCARSPSNTPAESAPPPPTSLPIGAVASSPGLDEASPSESSSRPRAGDDPTAEAEPGLRVPAPVTPPVPCGLRATLKDTGAQANGHRFSLTLTNTGPKALRLVVPGDGSEVGWRTPVVTWTAKVNGAPAAPTPGARCGMMNRIEPNEIITLAPGASRTIKDWIPPPEFAPGAYDLALTYRNDPGLQARKGGDESDVVKRLIAESAACEATTNAVHATLP